jgi:hypothetical protein
MSDNEWLMGALAAQDQYAPFVPSRATGMTPWKAADIKAAQAEEPRDPTLLDPKTNQFLGEMAVPSSPVDFGMMAMGPAGRVAGAAGKVAALAGGLYGELGTNEAQASKLGAAKAAIGDILNPSMMKARMKAEALHGKYPQYAESYPPVGPPALMSKTPDPKNPGKFTAKPGPEVPYASMEEAMAKDAEPGFFLQKKALPEVEQFMKDRNVIQQNLDRYGYDPYFDPAKRFDVNPKNYEPFADTGTAAAPKTAKADAEWYAKYGTAENRAKLQEGYKAGQGVPESADWYHMGQLEQEYIKHLGEKEGRAAFEKEFSGMMSATTGGAAPYDNFLMSQYANVAAKQGARLPERAYEMPSPIGGRYASGNIAQAQKYIDSGMARFDPAQNPKRYDFSGALTGNPMSATIDEQMYGALRPPTTPASQGVPEWYGPATRVAREEAAKAGVDPRAFQDVTWAGLKKGKTEGAGSVFDYEGPMINHINRSIETTHRLTGMPKDEIVRRGLIRKEIPMYGVGGAAVMGGLAAQDRYNKEEM